jgi:hypothetical protein
LRGGGGDEERRTTWGNRGALPMRMMLHALQMVDPWPPGVRAGGCTP